MTTFWSAIINSTILSAALTATVALILRLTSRRAVNAATRCAIWWTVLAITILLPLSYVSWRTTPAAPPTPSTPIANSDFTTPAPDLPLALPRIPPVEAAANRLTLPLAIPATQWLTAISLLWGATSALLLLRLLLSHIALHRRIARATNARPEWNAHIRQWMGPSRRHVRLAISNDIAIPDASGPINPTILIPTKLFNQLSPEDLEQIARHEAAHLVRYDDCALLLQRIIEALFALHPVVRYLTRQLDLEREVACDDVVAGSDEQARTYADCLTRTVALCGGVRNSLATANVADSRSHLSRRVDLLLNGTRDRHTTLLSAPFGVIAITLICLAGLLAKTPQLLAFAIPAQSSIVFEAPQTQSPVPPIAARGPQLLAQAQQTAPRLPLNPTQPDPSSPYHLQPGDAVAISFPDHPNLSANYNIGPDGQLTVALIGTLPAVGLTIPELQARLTEMFRTWVKEPIVSVHLLRNDHKWYAVGGWIPKPGMYPLLQQTTILDALVAAGGFEDVAVKENIYLLRNGTKYPFNYADAVSGAHPEQNLVLQDGDNIVVGVDRMPAPSNDAKIPDADYILKPNDVVAVAMTMDIWTDRRITGKYQIGADGQISLARMGAVHAAGLTISQLQALIEKNLPGGANPSPASNLPGSLNLRPALRVQLVRNNSPKYTLVGAVANPGPYPLLRETTVLDALAASGGFKAYAAKKTIYVVRAAAVMHSSARFSFNYIDVVEGRNLEQNITLRDGDVISVPGE